MADTTLTQITRLNMQIRGLLTALDIDLIGRETAKVITKIRQLSEDARLDVRDWEMAETRTEMLQHAKTAHKRLEDLRIYILRASEHGIFSAIDVISLSAQLDVIQSELD